MSKPSLRVVADDERPEPLTLLEAVERGDVLAMLKAQRRLIAESIVDAADNTRPQLNNELNKLHVLIAAEEAKADAAAMEEANRDNRRRERPRFDATAI